IFVLRSADSRPLHSFPTRRSSDLLPFGALFHLFTPFFTSHFGGAGGQGQCGESNGDKFGYSRHGESFVDKCKVTLKQCLHHSPRSEEHTSELQSRENLVCRLLLEK